MSIDDRPPMTLAPRPWRPEDELPPEFLWGGRQFGLFANNPTPSAAITSVTICYGEGGANLEDLPDEDLREIIVAWARWARHHKKVQAEAESRRKALTIANLTDRG